MEELWEDVIAVASGDWLDVLMGLPIGTMATIKMFLDDDECVDEDCPCDDSGCPKVSVDGEEVGCECCCDV